MADQSTLGNPGHLTKIKPQYKNQYIPNCYGNNNQNSHLDGLHIILGSPGSLAESCLQGFAKECQSRANLISAVEN